MIFQLLLYLQEQIELAVKHGADYIVGETFGHYGEATIALDSIKKYGAGMSDFMSSIVKVG